jgi:hypothetical protein
MKKKKTLKLALFKPTQFITKKKKKMRSEMRKKDEEEPRQVMPYVSNASATRSVRWGRSPAAAWPHQVSAGDTRLVSVWPLN